jgi:hypothetical protein
MRDFVTRLFIRLLIFHVLAATAAAQTGNWAAVEGLRTGSAISVRTINGKIFHGRFEAADPDHLVLWSDERSFPGRATVQRDLSRSIVMQVRLDRPMASMAAGAAIGAGIGVGLGVAAYAPSKDHEARGVVSLVFGALGAGLGAAIAKSHPFLHGPIIYGAP